MDGPEISLEAKLELRHRQALEFGKEFDEARERIVLGLPPLTREPVYVPPDDRRRKQTERDDAQGRKEMERMAAAAAEAARDKEMETRDEMIAQLQAQVAALMGNRADGIKPGIPEPEPARKGVPAAMSEDSIPSRDWSINQIVEWGKERGVTYRGGNTQGKSKTNIIDDLLGQLMEANAKEAPGVGTTGDPEDEAPL